MWHLYSIRDICIIKPKMKKEANCLSTWQNMRHIDRLLLKDGHTYNKANNEKTKPTICPPDEIWDILTGCCQKMWHLYSTGDICIIKPKMKKNQANRLRNMRHIDRLLSKDATSLQHKGHTYNKAKNEKNQANHLSTWRNMRHIDRLLSKDVTSLHHKGHTYNKAKKWKNKANWLNTIIFTVQWMANTALPWSSLAGIHDVLRY